VERNYLRCGAGLVTAVAGKGARFEITVPNEAYRFEGERE
jgi:hypothetical protein